MEYEHEIYWPTRGIEPGSSDRPSQSMCTVSQSPEPPRQATVNLIREPSPVHSGLLCLTVLSDLEVCSRQANNWLWSQLLARTYSNAFVHGSCASLECKASFEKSLNFRKLKKSLNCFGKRVEGLEKFGICIVLDDLVTVHTSCHSCCKTG